MTPEEAIRLNRQEMQDLSDDDLVRLSERSAVLEDFGRFKLGAMALRMFARQFVVECDSSKPVICGPASKRWLVLCFMGTGTTAYEIDDMCVVEATSAYQAKYRARDHMLCGTSGSVDYDPDLMEAYDLSTLVPGWTYMQAYTDAREQN